NQGCIFSSIVIDSPFCDFRVLLLHHLTSFFLLLQPPGAQSELISSNQPIIALAGDDVILPCYLEPPISVTSKTVMWIRPGWYPEPEVLWLDGEGNLLSAGPPETVRGPDDLYTVSSRVTVEKRHSNRFTCRVQQKNINQTREAHIHVPVQSELISSNQPIITLAGDDVILPCYLEPPISVTSKTVTWIRPGSVSTPVIELFSNNSGSAVLRCKSEGWYPEPEVLWLGRRVTVEKRHSNRFTCRVQQKNINQTREAHIHVAAQSELISSNQPIITLAGDDVILPCYLEPPISVTSKTVMWIRPGLDPKYIHVHEDGRPVYLSQNSLYSNRTTLFEDQLMNGNVSLNIYKVKPSDTGTYICILESTQREVSVIVGSVSTPVIELFSNNNGSAVLRCKSEGWYPEPEVLWLDGEGNLLSAGPPETVRGPDDLYTVSSRVTVEKRHSNRFTCRVQQKNINQTREAHIHVQADFFRTSSYTVVLYIFAVIAVIVAVLVTVVILRRIKKVEDTKRHAIENDYEFPPRREKNKQLDLEERSQTEESSGAGNNSEDERQNILQSRERCSRKRIKSTTD
ncbi:hypothetical protein L3Q82_016581, partial [Scortum barcoo]